MLKKVFKAFNNSTKQESPLPRICRSCARLHLRRIDLTSWLEIRFRPDKSRSNPISYRCSPRLSESAPTLHEHSGGFLKGTRNSEKSPAVPWVPHEIFPVHFFSHVGAASSEQDRPERVPDRLNPLGRLISQNCRQSLIAATGPTSLHGNEGLDLLSSPLRLKQEIG